MVENNKVTVAIDIANGSRDHCRPYPGGMQQCLLGSAGMPTEYFLKYMAGFEKVNLCYDKY